ncbi:hypothetical protein HO173_003108 [Letharia columbiana]|uniref:tRNA synthetases class I catalytic domain-containing protein n=1 Tax=Letharia columbiana TaxID=112416 RepID=A0A8H6L7H5_9LECA|nr:uncharacterized protein HO173_003108 [Letharia columbiana]KAF6238602.1 hypothetical protein HO173_003108 [Letharia columbiana]
MNYTDVDDKIIVRARQQHLLRVFKQERLEATSDVTGTRLAALEAYLTKNLPRISQSTSPENVESEITKHYSAVLSGHPLDPGTLPGDREAKVKMHIKTARGASTAIGGLEQGRDLSEDNLADLEDVIMPWLDQKFGSSVAEKAIFLELTKNFEERFEQDMVNLNCLAPDIITRVSDYAAQIVKFVQVIQQNGFAYSLGGSVYFDIEAFEAAGNTYARLEPWSRQDAKLIAEGEGSLTEAASEKRSTADFALWKASKPGEPSWDSPWGKGRPGWHIECSAMAVDKLGDRIDIHSGGIDLSFPHHDNEIAQSEAYFCHGKKSHQQWVQYFFHTGHLSISGAKMSKSLKNFTTIRQALNSGDWTPRGLRIVFLMHSWSDGIEINEGSKDKGSSWEEKLNNFFINGKAVLEDPDHVGIKDSKHDLDGELERKKQETYEALCDSFDTPTVMDNISRLITAYNTVDPSTVSQATTKSIAFWVTEMVNMFGLNGIATPETATTIGWSGIDVPEGSKPILISLSNRRDSLRRKAKADAVVKDDLTPIPIPVSSHTLSEAQTRTRASFAEVLKNVNQDIDALDATKSAKDLSKDVLRLCDRIRNVDLWDNDVYLEDREGNKPALIRLVTRELRATKEQEQARERKKQEDKEKREKDAAAKVEKGRLSHKEMFRSLEFSAWDDDGLPTKDKEGEEISKSRKKKLQKDWERQKKLHEVWTEAQKK